MVNIVYVLTNPAMPGLVKIGMTDRDDVQRRMSDLYTTGVPLPFECRRRPRNRGQRCPRNRKGIAHCLWTEQGEFLAGVL